MKFIDTLYEAGFDNNEAFFDLTAREFRAAFSANEAFSYILERDVPHHSSILDRAGMRLADCNSDVILMILFQGDIIPAFKRAAKEIPDIVNREDLFGWTPLCRAIETDRKDIIDALVECNVDVSKPLFDRLPLFFATDVDLIMHLLRVVPSKQVYAADDGYTFIDYLHIESISLGLVHSACKFLVRLGVDCSEDARKAFIKSGFSFDKCLSNEDKIYDARYNVFFNRSLVSQLLSEVREGVAPPQRRSIEPIKFIYVYGDSRDYMCE